MRFFSKDIASFAIQQVNAALEEAAKLANESVQVSIAMGAHEHARVAATILDRIRALKVTP